MLGLDHIAISVTEMNRSVEFYGKLGFEFHKSWKAEDGSIEITLLTMDGMFLELFCYRENFSMPETAKSVVTDLPVIGTKHFALHTDNLTETAEFLINAGIINAMPEIKTGRLGRDYFFIADPDNILVEIISA